MKTIYFNLSNGEVVDPSKYLPAYKATIRKGYIAEIAVCFSLQNITKNGYEWVENNVKKEKEEWDRIDLLKNSLNFYIRKWTLLHPFKDTNFQESHFHRFVFIPFWRSN
jgi:hypothetical protein